jgi:hypothetical protein
MIVIYFNKLVVLMYIKILKKFIIIFIYINYYLLLYIFFINKIILNVF